MERFKFKDVQDAIGSRYCGVGETLYSKWLVLSKTIISNHLRMILLRQSFFTIKQPGVTFRSSLVMLICRVQLMRSKDSGTAFIREIRSHSFFLDDFFNQQYKEDRQFGRMFTAFSIIVVLIACLGLFGLSYFNAVQRTKEVGIRKVLGAGVSSIVGHLLKDFMMLIIVANLVAWPLTYVAISNWLDGYAFHIDITPWLFIGPGMVVMLIGVLTVSYHTSRVAQTNPVNVLRLD